MHLVNNIDFEARRAGRIAHIIDNLANIANAGARGGVHLNHINMGAVHNGGAMRAVLSQRHAGRVHGLGLIIQGACQNPRRGGFADPAHTGQHKAMRDASAVKCIGQGLHHRLLADEVVKIARPIFPRQHLIAAIRRAIIARLVISAIIRIGIGQHVKARGIIGKFRRLSGLFNLVKRRIFAIGQRVLRSNIVFVIFCHHRPKAAVTIIIIASGHLNGSVRDMRGERLDRQPAPNSLGLLPSGSDPVGEGCVCRQSLPFLIAEAGDRYSYFATD